MSMDVSIACMAEATSGVVVDILDSGMCRGMLAGSPQGPTRMAGATPDSRQGGDHTPGGGLSRRPSSGGGVGNAGTLHTRGEGGWDSRDANGHFDSESD